MCFQVFFPEQLLNLMTVDLQSLLSTDRRRGWGNGAASSAESCLSGLVGSSVGDLVTRPSFSLRTAPPIGQRMDHDQNGELEAERGGVCCVLAVIVCVFLFEGLCCAVCVCPLSVDPHPPTLRLSVYFQDPHSSVRRASTSRVRPAVTAGSSSAPAPPSVRAAERQRHESETHLWHWSAPVEASQPDCPQGIKSRNQQRRSPQLVLQRCTMLQFCHQHENIWKQKDKKCFLFVHFSVFELVKLCGPETGSGTSLPC